MLDSNDEQRLLEVISIYEETMETVVQCSRILFRQPMREPFRVDWQELQNELSTLKKEISHGDANRFKRAGLTGKQLQHKVEWLKEAKSLFDSMGSLRFLKKLLEKLNIILKSIIGAIPGAGSALSEFKDIAEKEIEDTEENLSLTAPVELKNAGIHLGEKK
ncbi:MAG: hypothetical protein NPIRA05_01440 [Nitrospirales bacterium]|nr:MAG: hypothetical protein NPIRA05_01440 [Nitrospirales bacterium]